MFEKPRPWWHGTHIARILVGAMFLLAGVVKLTDLGAFHRDILAYQILLKQPSGWIALTLPVMEVLLGLLMLAGVLRAACYAAVLVLSAVFSFVHVYSMQRGLDVGCGCFGALSLTGPVMLGLNVVLLFLSLALLRDDLRVNVVEKPKYRLSNDLMRGRRL